MNCLLARQIFPIVCTWTRKVMTFFYIYTLYSPHFSSSNIQNNKHLKWHHLTHHMEGLLCYLLHLMPHVYDSHKYTHLFFFLHLRLSHSHVEGFFFLLILSSHTEEYAGNKKKYISKCGKQRLLWGKCVAVFFLFLFISHLFLSFVCSLKPLS